MKCKSLLVLLVAVIAFAVVAVQNVSALEFAQITKIELNDIEVLNGNVDLANLVGERVKLTVSFFVLNQSHDARIKAWISGEGSDAVLSDRVDALEGRTYVRTVYLTIPDGMGQNLQEPRDLQIIVESREHGIGDQASVRFTAERESYQLQIINVNFAEPQVNAGELLGIDVVLKNRGRHNSYDTFLTATIPELGIETSTFYGDLSAFDRGGNESEKEDTVQKRTYLRIPADVPAGFYTVKLKAYNSDSVAETERRVFVVGAGDDTKVISAVTSKTFSESENGEFDLTLINRGKVLRVYELIVDAPNGLNIDVAEPIVVVPAGSSRTVKITAASSKEGSYTFSVNVHSDDGELLETSVFKANVEKGKSTVSVAANTTVLLTVILAIVFVVLLVVLIVLLTRKPQKSEEFGESYY